MNGGYIYDDDTLLGIKTLPSGAARAGTLRHGGDFGLFWLLRGRGDANVAADYAPLADTTFWLEWRFWGNNGDLNGPDVNPAFRNSIGSHGYHTTNIILHGIAALLLWYLLAQIRIPGAWLASLVWAVHPVCAESVAWIAERRNPLSMILFILTMINWFHFQRSPAGGGGSWRALIDWCENLIERFKSLSTKWKCAFGLGLLLCAFFSWISAGFLACMILFCVIAPSVVLFKSLTRRTALLGGGGFVCAHDVLQDEHCDASSCCCCSASGGNGAGRSN